MREWQSQTYVRWHCIYHVVIVPKKKFLEYWEKILEECSEICAINWSGIGRGVCDAGSCPSVFECTAKAKCSYTIKENPQL